MSENIAQDVPMNKQQNSQEYAKLCASSGDLAYRIKCMQLDMDKIHQRQLELNVMASKLPAEEAKEEVSKEKEEA